MIEWDSINLIVNRLKLFVFLTAPKTSEEVNISMQYEDVGTIITNLQHIRVSKYISMDELPNFIAILEDLFSLTWVRRFWQKSGLSFEKNSENKYLNRSMRYGWHIKWNGPFMVDEKAWTESFIEQWEKNLHKTAETFKIDMYSTPDDSSKTTIMKEVSSESSASVNSPIPNVSLILEFEDVHSEEKKMISDESIVNELKKEKERCRQIEKSRYYYKSKCKDLQKRLEALEDELFQLRQKCPQDTGNHSPVFQTGTSEGTSEDTSSVDENDTKESLNTILCGLIRDKESYFEDTSERTLSVRAGFHCLNLVTACKVPKRMIPQVVATVIHMLFGDVGSKSMSKVLKGWDTYTLAMDKAAYLNSKEIERWFFENQDEDTIVSAQLVQDASNKKNKDMVLRFCNCRLKSGEIKSIALEPDYAMSKKADINYQQAMQSFEKLGELGRAKIKGGTTDGFSAAVDEMIKILVDCDKAASNCDPEKLTYKSNQVPGMIYAHDGTFRQYRNFRCVMHSLERFLEPFLSAFTQGTGMDKILAVGQTMYLISYLMDKFHNEIDRFHEIAVGGMAYIENLPPELLLTLQQACATRWITIERAADQLVQLLHFPASQRIIELFQEKHGVIEATKIFSLYPCLGGSDPSYFCLLFYWLFDHTTDLGSESLKVLGFLSSPFSRICLLFLASMHSHHLLWAGFADSKGKDNASSTLSARMKDTPVFYKNVLEFLEGLEKDWKAVLGQYFPLIEGECERAENTVNKSDIDVNRITGLKFFERKLMKVIPEMQEKAKKYYVDTIMSVGFSPLGLFDPYLAPYCAKAFLHILRKEKSPPYRIASPATSMISSVEWKCYSTTHAFPNITYQYYANQIYEQFRNCPHASDILRSLGFKHSTINVQVAQELRKLGEGHLHRILRDNSSGWAPGTLPSEYMNVFKREFPAIADSISFNYDFMSITSVVCEQAFSCCNFLVDPHDSREYVQGKFLFFQNFTGDIVRKLNLRYATQLCNNKNKLLQYHLETIHKIDIILGRNYPMPSRNEIRGEGKKTNELLNNLPFIEKQISSNTKSPGKRLTIAEAERARQDFDYACITNQCHSVPPKPEYIIPDFVKSAPKKIWQPYLIEQGIYTQENVPHSKTKAVKHHLEQECMKEPPTEVREKQENARKKAKVTETAVIY